VEEAEDEDRAPADTDMGARMLLPEGKIRAAKPHLFYFIRWSSIYSEKSSPILP
jgi:hypothetical protein